MDTSQTNSAEEQKLVEQSDTSIKASIENSSLLNFHKNEYIPVAHEKNSIARIDLHEPKADSSEGHIHIKIWKNKIISIKKSMIPLRMAQFLWFGGGRLLVYFLLLILKDRGFTIVQYSSTTTFAFLFQFASSSISGVIADKIGNAKPVLIFHMSATLAVIISILLAPRIYDESCTSQNNWTCSDILENGGNLTFCNYTCFENNTKIFNFEESDENDFTKNFAEGVLKNSSFLMGTNKVFMNFSGISELNVSHYLCKENCSTFCLIHSEEDCASTYRKGMVTVYITLILCFYTFWTTAYRFLDFAALSAVKDHDSDFAKERMVGVFGELSMAILIALMLNVNVPSGLQNNYDSVYWFCAVSILLSIISIYNFKLVIFPPSRQLKKKAFILLKDSEAMAFMGVVFVAGNVFCFNVNFHSVYLHSLKASKTIISVHPLTFGFYGVLGLLTFKWWLKKFGTTKIFVIGLLSYSISEAAYSFLYNPWFSLIIEISVIFTYHLLWVAAVIHSHRIAPEGFAATLNAVAGAVHFGIGRSTGVLGGGLLMNFLGARVTYRILAAFCLVAAIMYSVFLYWKHLHSLKKPRKQENGKAEELISMNGGDNQEV